MTAYISTMEVLPYLLGKKVLFGFCFASCYVYVCDRINDKINVIFFCFLLAVVFMA